MVSYNNISSFEVFQILIQDGTLPSRSAQTMIRQFLTDFTDEKLKFNEKKCHYNTKKKIIKKNYDNYL